MELRNSQGTVTYKVGPTSGKIMTENGTTFSPGGASLPAGLIVMWHGLIANIPSGWVMCDGQNGTPDLRSKFIKGAAAGVEAGSTGGALTHTHANHPALSHSGTAVADHAAHTHSVTSNVAVDAHSGAAVSAHSGTAVADHAAHTHQYTDVPNHTHPHNMQGGTTGATTGTNVMGSTATGGSSRAMAIATGNPTGGVATGTTQGPCATLTHSVTQPANHTVTQPANHTVTNNQVTSGNPSATLTHSVTQPSDHAAQSHDSPNHEPPYYSVIYIMKT